MTADALETGGAAQRRVQRSLFARIRTWLKTRNGSQYRITDKGLEVDFANSMPFIDQHGARNARIIGSVVKRSHLGLKR